MVTRDPSSNGGGPPLASRGILRTSKKGIDLSAIYNGARPAIPGGGRLSRPLLQKIFVGMLAVVFLLYCLFMLMLVRHDDKHLFNAEGKWGPSVVPTSEIALREHIRSIEEARQRMVDEQEQQRNTVNGEPAEGEMVTRVSSEKTMATVDHEVVEVEIDEHGEHDQTDQQRDALLVQTDRFVSKT